MGYTVECKLEDGKKVAEAEFLYVADAFSFAKKFYAPNIDVVDNGTGEVLLTMENSQVAYTI